MIPYLAAEKFAKSKFALIIGLVMVIGVLVAVIIYQDNKSQADAKQYREDLAAERKVSSQKDSLLHQCQEKGRIADQNATAAEKLRAQKFEKLYLEVMDLKEAARQKNIIP